VNLKRSKKHKGPVSLDPSSPPNNHSSNNNIGRIAEENGEPTEAHLVNTSEVAATTTAALKGADKGSVAVAVASAPLDGNSASAAAPKHTQALRAASMLEIISYVRQEGEDMGFLYLCPRAPRGNVRRIAYDLQVVSHAGVDRDEFFTISSAGVTHLCGSRSTFTPLDRFEAEVALCARLRSMPLFSLFRQWKSFTRWRKAVTSARMSACAEKLDAQLFILSDILRPAELTIRSMCLDVVNMRLVSVEPDRTYTLKEFLAAQETQLSQVAKKLDGFRGEIMGVVRKACDAAFAAHGYAVHITPETYTEQARKRQLCARLLSFVRLADFLVANAMQALCSESVAFLRSHFERLREEALQSGAQLRAKIDAMVEELQQDYERQMSARRAKRQSTTGLEEPSDAKIPEARDLLRLPSGDHICMRKQSDGALGGLKSAIIDRSGQAVKAVPLLQVGCFGGGGVGKSSVARFILLELLSFYPFLP
jgi:hypothetical protein